MPEGNLMTHYDILGVHSGASQSDILRGYGNRIAEICSAASTPQSNRSLTAVQEAFSVLSHRGSRAQYDALMRKSAAKVASHGIESLDFFIELHRLSWRGLVVYPFGLTIQKLFAELLSRVFMMVVGGFAGFFIALWTYSDVVTSGVDSMEAATVPGTIKLLVAVTAAVFFFYKEIYRLCRRMFL